MTVSCPGPSPCSGSLVLQRSAHGGEIGQAHYHIPPRHKESVRVHLRRKASGRKHGKAFLWLVHKAVSSSKQAGRLAVRGAKEATGLAGTPGAPALLLGLLVPFGFGVPRRRRLTSLLRRGRGAGITGLAIALAAVLALILPAVAQAIPGVGLHSPSGITAHSA